MLLLWQPWGKQGTGTGKKKGGGGGVEEAGNVREALGIDTMQ